MTTKAKQQQQMKNPPHPGEIIKEMLLDPLEITVTQAAKDMKMAYSTLSRLINGHSSVSNEMAVKLEKTFGGNAEHWLNLQANYDRARLPEIRETVRINKSYLEDETQAVA